MFWHNAVPSNSAVSEANIAPVCRPKHNCAASARLCFERFVTLASWIRCFEALKTSNSGTVISGVHECALHKASRNACAIRDGSGERRTIATNCTLYLHSGCSTRRISRSPKIRRRNDRARNRGSSLTEPRWRSPLGRSRRPGAATGTGGLPPYSASGMPGPHSRSPEDRPNSARHGCHQTADVGGRSRVHPFCEQLVVIQAVRSAAVRHDADLKPT